MTDVPPPSDPTPQPSPVSPPTGPIGLNYSSIPSDFNWTDFLTFRTMISIPVIMILFWVGVLWCLVAGIGMMFSGHGMGGVCAGFAVILFGPFIVRLQCEFLIVVFRINETATEILNTLRGRPPRV